MLNFKENVWGYRIEFQILYLVNVLIKIVGLHFMQEIQWVVMVRIYLSQEIRLTVQAAHYIDWNIDSKGAFKFDGFFSALRGVEDVSKLKTLKIDLEAANDSITAHELADTLVELEPSFDKFKNILSSLPADKISTFINTIIAIITLVIMLQTMQSADDNHEESIAIQKEQHSLAREQFEYQKEQDKKQEENKKKTTLL